MSTSTLTVAVATDSVYAFTIAVAIATVTVNVDTKGCNCNRNCTLSTLRGARVDNICIINAYCSQCGILFLDITSFQCYSVLSDVLVKNKICIPLERGSNVLSTGEGSICLSLPSKLEIAVLFCSIYRKTISFGAIVF